MNNTVDHVHLIDIQKKKSIHHQQKTHSSQARIEHFLGEAYVRLQNKSQQIQADRIYFKYLSRLQWYKQEINKRGKSEKFKHVDIKQHTHEQIMYKLKK